MSRLSSVLFLLVALAPAAAGGGEIHERWGLGLEAGLLKWTGGRYDYSNLDQGLALRLHKGLSRRWSVNLGCLYGTSRPGVDRPGDDAGWTFASGAGLYTVSSFTSLEVRCHPLGTRSVSPWLGLAVGYMDWRVLDRRGKDVGLLPGGPTAHGHDETGADRMLTDALWTTSLAMGVERFVGESFRLGAGYRRHLLPGNEKDTVGLGLDSLFGPDHVDANRALNEFYLDLTWFFGSGDRDDDGIRDAKDACPVDAEDFDGWEDEDGCPDLDNDRDGILDSRDACPDVPEDRDGFADEDGCPEPDNDGDGIEDTADGCPDQPEDVDGYQDEDGCPDLDDDGDGIPDAEDRCPETPAGANVDERGCPRLGAISSESVLQGVTFLSGRSVLTDESFALLRELADSLLTWQEVRIEIHGHTDAQGNAEANRDLSQRRANAVRQALIGLGVPAERLVAVGFGEDFPVGTNETEAGRELNRRVEIHRVDR